MLAATERNWGTKLKDDRMPDYRLDGCWEELLAGEEERAGDRDREGKMTRSPGKRDTCFRQ